MGQRLDILLRTAGPGSVRATLLEQDQTLHEVVLPEDGGFRLEGVVNRHRPVRDIEVGEVRRFPHGLAAAIRHGTDLFGQVFGDVGARRLREIRARSRAQGEAVTIRVVHLNSAGLDFPVEILCDPENDGGPYSGFLVLADDVVLFHDYGSTIGAPPPAASSITTLLFLGVSPKDQVPANIDQEWKAIADSVQRATFRGIQILLEPDRPVRLTRETLTRLRRGEGGRTPQETSGSRAHLVHVAGHGAPNPVTGVVDFLLESPDGHTERVSGTVLAEAVCAERAVALATFNSCFGIALALEFLKAGASQVIGHRAAASDRAAVEFAQTFYDRLFAEQDVGNALRTARRRVFEVANVGAFKRQGSPAGPLDWVNPVWFRTPHAWIPTMVPVASKARRSKTWTALKRLATAAIAGTVMAGAAALLWSALDDGASTGLNPPDRWPDYPALLFLPFEGAPERPVDKALWPLAHRFLFNALEPEERYERRLKRVDPARSDDILQRRGLAPPYRDNDVRVLAQEFGADVVMRGRVGLDGNVQVVEVELLAVPPHDRGRLSSGAKIYARRSRLTDAARDLASKTMGILAPGQREVKDEDLLLGGAEARRTFPRVPTDTSSAQRIRMYRDFLDRHPNSPGTAWLLFLEQAEANRAFPALAQVASKVGDADLASFFLEVSMPHASCDLAKSRALGSRYPFLLGHLAPAACLFRQGSARSTDALTEALWAVRDQKTRTIATPFLVRLLPPDCGQGLSLRKEVLSLLPESPVGWSATAVWETNCDDDEGAALRMDVARALLGEDLATAYRVTHHALLVAMMAGRHQEAEAMAAEWRRLHERLHASEGRPDPWFYSTYGLFETQRGRFRDGFHVFAEGLRVLAGKDTENERSEYGFTHVANSHVFAALTEARARPGERAEWVRMAGDAVERFRGAFRISEDPANAYIVAVLDRLVRAFEWATPPTTVKGVGIDEVNDEYLRELESVGRLEQQTIETAYVAAFLGDTETCERLVRSESGSRHMAGCEVVVAKRLLESGHVGMALDKLRKASRDLYLLPVVFPDLIPKTLMLLAQAEEAAGNRERALEVWRRLAASYDHADREVPEHVTAHERLVKRP